MAHTEVGASPTEELDGLKFEATRTLECAFDDRLTLGRELQGEVREIADGEFEWMRPQRYPHMDYAFVDQVSVDPFGKTTGSGSSAVQNWESARLTVVYRIPKTGGVDQDDEDAEDELLVTESLEPTMEILTIPNQKLWWDAGCTKRLSMTEAPAYLLRTCNWVYAREKLPTLGDEFFTYIGKVNNAAITSRTIGYTFPPETLLYKPPHTEREIWVSGAKTWKATLRLTVKPEGWNVFPRVKDDSTIIEWGAIYNANGARIKPYGGVDFLKILRA